MEVETKSQGSTGIYQDLPAELRSIPKTFPNHKKVKPRISPTTPKNGNDSW